MFTLCRDMIGRVVSAATCRCRMKDLDSTESRDSTRLSHFCFIFVLPLSDDNTAFVLNVHFSIHYHQIIRSVSKESFLLVILPIGLGEEQKIFLIKLGIGRLYKLCKNGSTQLGEVQWPRQISYWTALIISLNDFT